MTTTTMNAATARERMIQFLENVEDARVLGLYTFLAEEIEEEIGQGDEYPEELKMQLDKVEDDIKHCRKEMFISEEELHNRITVLLKK